MFSQIKPKSQLEKEFYSTASSNNHFTVFFQLVPYYHFSGFLNKTFRFLYSSHLLQLNSFFFYAHLNHSYQQSFFALKRILLRFSVCAILCRTFNKPSLWTKEPLRIGLGHHFTFKLGNGFLGSDHLSSCTTCGNAKLLPYQFGKLIAGLKFCKDKLLELRLVFLPLAPPSSWF